MRRAQPPADRDPLPTTSTSCPGPRLRYAAAIIRAGGVVAYPTEGVYGFGCRPDDRAAVGWLLALKKRPVSAGLILLAADREQLEGWVEPTPEEERHLSGTHAGPVTWVVRAGPRTPDWISGGRNTVAVRLTTHAVAADLCRAAGMPLVSTSANRRGKAPARTAVAVRARFGRQIPLIVGGAVGHLTGPTPIRLAATGAYLRTTTP